jgi:hypothetical protein
MRAKLGFIKHRWERQLDIVGQTELKGGCACGALRYTVADQSGFVPYVCHCLDCQTRQGSSFALQLFVLESEFSLVGEPILGLVKKANGAVVTNTGCGNCLTRICSANSIHPGFIVLRAGTLDNSHRLEPGVHIWTSRKQPWLKIPDGVPTYAEQPEDNSIWRALVRPQKLTA